MEDQYYIDGKASTTPSASTPELASNVPVRATKTQRLLAAEKFELAIHLHRIGWEGRLFMRHVQLRRTQAGPTIALINNHGSADRS